MKRKLQNLKNKLFKHKIIIPSLVVVMVLVISVGYSSFNQSLRISNTVTMIRTQADVRVSDITVESSTNGGISNYDEYDVKKVYANIQLPNIDSTVTYSIKVVNIGNVEVGINKIIDLPNNLNINIEGYELNSILCDDNTSNKCTNGSVTTFYITIGYSEEFKANNISTELTNYIYDLSLGFDFKEMFRITYTNIDSTNLVKAVIANEDLVLDLGSSAPSNVKIKIDGNEILCNEYIYSKGILKLDDINGEIEIIENSAGVPYCSFSTTSQTTSVKNNNSLVLNYKIYGNSIQNGTPTIENPVEIQSVGDMSINLFDISNYTTVGGTLAFDASNLVEGKTYTISSNKPLHWLKISNHPSGYNSVTTGYRVAFYTYTFTMMRNANIDESATQYIFLGVESGVLSTDISDFDGYEIQIEEGTNATTYQKYGKYIIPITVSSVSPKNLFNIDNFVSDSAKAVINNNDGTLTVNRSATSTGVGAQKMTLSHLAPGLEVGKTYTLSAESTDSLKRIYLVKSKFLWYFGTSRTITQDDLDSGVYFYASTVGVPAIVSNIQIEEGTKATEYTPYLLTKNYNIALDEPLRSVGETSDYLGKFSDYIDFETKQVVRNIVKITLDGSQSFAANATVVEGYDTFDILNSVLGLKGNTTVMSNKFIGTPFWSNAKPYKREQLSSALYQLTLRLAQSRGVEHSADGINNWLKDNPVEILHVLKTPQYIDIDLPEITSFGGKTQISIGTSVAPDQIDLKYSE